MPLRHSPPPHLVQAKAIQTPLRFGQPSSPVLKKLGFSGEDDIVPDTFLHKRNTHYFVIIYRFEQIEIK